MYFLPIASATNATMGSVSNISVGIASRMTRYSQGHYWILVEDMRYCFRRSHGISLVPWHNISCVGTWAGVSGEARCKSMGLEDQLG